MSRRCFGVAVPVPARLPAGLHPAGRMHFEPQRAPRAPEPWIWFWIWIWIRICRQAAATPGLQPHPARCAHRVDRHCPLGSRCGPHRTGSSSCRAARAARPQPVIRCRRCACACPARPDDDPWVGATRRAAPGAPKPHRCLSHRAEPDPRPLAGLVSAARGPSAYWAVGRSRPSGGSSVFTQPWVQLGLQPASGGRAPGSWIQHLPFNPGSGIRHLRCPQPHTGLPCTRPRLHWIWICICILFLPAASMVCTTAVCYIHCHIAAPGPPEARLVHCCHCHGCYNHRRCCSRCRCYGPCHGCYSYAAIPGCPQRQPLECRSCAPRQPPGHTTQQPLQLHS